MKLLARVDGYLSRFLGALNLAMVVFLVLWIITFASGSTLQANNKNRNYVTTDAYSDSDTGQRLATLETEVGDLRDWKSKEEDKKLESRIARLEDTLEMIKEILIGIFVSLVLLLIETAHRLFQRRIDRGDVHVT